MVELVARAFIFVCFCGFTVLFAAGARANLIRDERGRRNLRLGAALVLATAASAIYTVWVATQIPN